MDRSDRLKRQGMRSLVVACGHGRLALAVAVAGSGWATTDASAANSTWLATPADADWANPANWTAGAPGATGTTTNADLATFSSTLTNAFGTAGSPILVDPNRNIRTLFFNTSAASPYVIGTAGGNALSLTSGGSFNMTATVANAQTVNAPLIFQPATATTPGAYTFLNDATATASAMNVGGPVSLGVTTATDTLTLSGVNVGTNTLSGTFNPTGAAGGLILSKAGTGTWTFGGNGTSTGRMQIAVGAGTFNFGSATDAPTFAINAQTGSGGNSGVTVTGTGTVFNMNAGTLSIVGVAQGLIVQSTQTYNQSGGTVTSNGLHGFANQGGASTVNITAGTLASTNATVNGTQLAVRGVTTVNLSGTGILTTPVLNMSTNQLSGGAAGSTMNLNAGGTINAGSVIRGTNSTNGTTTFNFNAGTLRATAANASFLTGLTRANVRDGGAVIDTDAFSVTVGQPLLHSNVAGDAATDGGLTKLGSGTLTLTGINTYTGDTTVSGGTLTLADNAGLLFVIGADDVNNGIVGSGIATLSGDFTFDMTSAGKTIGDAWTIVDNATLTEAFNPSFTVAGFAPDAGGDLWTLGIDSSRQYSFAESTGTLSVEELAVVPEPSAIALLGVGSLAVLRRRRASSAS